MIQRLARTAKRIRVAAQITAFAVTLAWQGWRRDLMLDGGT